MSDLYCPSLNYTRNVGESHGDLEKKEILSIVLRKFIFNLNRHGYHIPVRPGSVKSAVHEACS